jgi:hypothetical protein
VPDGAAMASPTQQTPHVDGAPTVEPLSIHHPSFEAVIFEPHQETPTTEDQTRMLHSDPTPGEEAIQFGPGKGSRPTDHFTTLPTNHFTILFDPFIKPSQNK